MERAYSQRKDKVTKKYNPEKKKASYKKQNEASDEVNKHTIYIAQQSTMLPGCIRPWCPHAVC